MPALMQIVAYGAQDVYLTGNPSISHFKSVYRRHTNFAVESIQCPFDTSAPGFGDTAVATLTRNGDLITGAYVKLELPDLIEKALSNFALTDDTYSGPNQRYVRWVDNLGHYIFRYVEIEVNDRVIDRHYADWMEIWSQLSLPAEKQAGYREMIGQDRLNRFGQNTGLQADVFSTERVLDNTDGIHGPVDNVVVGREIFVPLQFWFCRDVGMALPMVAMQHCDVRLRFQLETAENLVMVYEPESGGWVSNTTEHGRLSNRSTTALGMELWVDYAFLDADERRRFTQVSHEYLIEQVQRNEFSVRPGTDANPALNNLPLSFFHPVKELIWVVKPFDERKQWCNYSNTRLRDLPPQHVVNLTENPDEVTPGLAGLPLGMDGTAASAALTVSLVFDRAVTNVGDPIPIGGAALTLTVNNAQRFSPLDLIKLQDAGTGWYVVLMVTTVDDDGHPTAVSLHSTSAEADGEHTYAVVVSVEHLSAGGNGVPMPGLGSIVTYDDLVNFSSYSSTRPWNQHGRADNPVKSAVLLLNHTERFAERPGVYFNRYQTLRHHTNVPASPGINVYSFALEPENNHPTGSCNFSRIDNVQLNLKLGGLYAGGATGAPLTTDELPTVMKAQVFAVSYNVFRVWCGMGAVAFTS